MPPARPAGRSHLGGVVLGLTVLALAGLLLWSATHGHLPQFQGKAMQLRLVCVPVAAAIVPASWWFASRLRRRRLAFPYAPAVLVALSLTIDLAGNATRLYDTVEHFDDAVHAVNPVLLVCAVSGLLRHTGVPRWATWVMAVGIGCAGNIAWEVAEYGLMDRLGATELGLSLPDTLSDQAWGLLGAAVGATVPMLMSFPAEQPSAWSVAADRAGLPAAVPEQSLASTT